MADHGILQKAVIEIINDQPEEIKVTEAGEKKSPGISTDHINKSAEKLLKNPKSSVMARKGEERVRFVVQFNPAELQVAAEGETDSQSYISDAAGSGNNIGICQLSSRARVNFKLIFDDTDKEKPAVQKQVEGFMAAIRNEHTRRVSFIWGNIVYSGVLNSIQASYTMFHPDGRPVHAEVQIGILCMDQEEGQENMGRWKQCYQELVRDLEIG